MLCSYSLVLEVGGERSRRNTRFRRWLMVCCGADLLRGFTLLTVSTIRQHYMDVCENKVKDLESREW
jgi:hypothetical protein